MYRSDKGAAPKTWDEVKANADKNKAANFYGYLVRGKATNPIVADFLPILWSFGGDVFDQNWNVTIDNAASLKAVKFLVQDLKAAAQPGPESTDAADRDRLMAIGQGYQSTVWPGEITSVIQNASVSQVVGKVAYIPMPAGPSGKGVGMMGNWLLGVPKASPNGQAAADFITWLTSSDTQKTYVDNGGIPARKSLLNDAALNTKNPYFSALAKSLDAVPNWRPRTDQWNAVETILGTNLNAALAGTATPEAAVQKAADAIRTLMKGAGY
jgi:multiple sugar transport system substrate-binding protein